MEASQKAFLAPIRISALSFFLVRIGRGHTKFKGSVGHSSYNIQKYFFLSFKKEYIYIQCNVKPEKKSKEPSPPQGQRCLFWVIGYQFFYIFFFCFCIFVHIHLHLKCRFSSCFFLDVPGPPHLAKEEHKSWKFGHFFWCRFGIVTEPAPLKSRFIFCFFVFFLNKRA